MSPKLSVVAAFDLVLLGVVRCTPHGAAWTFLMPREEWTAIPADQRGTYSLRIHHN